MHKILPIGTVVSLLGEGKKIMIIGVKQKAEDVTDHVYDYLGVLYPEGFVGENYTILFDHEDINDIYFIGYENEEQSVFSLMLTQIYHQKQIV